MIKLLIIMVVSGCWVFVFILLESSIGIRFRIVMLVVIIIGCMCNVVL